jgi:hypothetical protein
MRSHFVVFATPGFDLPAGVVCRLARPAEIQNQAVVVDPEIALLLREPAALVDADRPGKAMVPGHPLQRRHNVCAGASRTDIDGGREHLERVDDGQDPDFRAVEELVGQEFIARVTPV